MFFTSASVYMITNFKKSHSKWVEMIVQTDNKKMAVYSTFQFLLLYVWKYHNSAYFCRNFKILLSLKLTLYYSNFDLIIISRKWKYQTCLFGGGQIKYVFLMVIWLRVFRSSTGAFFASCSHDRTARLWRPDRLYPIRTFIGHTMDVDVSHCCHTKGMLFSYSLHCATFPSLS